MRVLALLLGVVILTNMALIPPARGEAFPKPSVYPISWELKFEHGQPKRLVMPAEPGGVPQAYWYIAYNVTNNTDKEQLFLPLFELVTKDGRVIRSDRNVPVTVFERIKELEGNRFLTYAPLVGGELRLGQDEARDGVAIWPEPDSEMGNFQIYVSGLSGETAKVKAGDKEIIVRKTLELNFLVPGDTQTTGQAAVTEQSQKWVMR